MKLQSGLVAISISITCALANASDSASWKGEFRPKMTVREAENIAIYEYRKATKGKVALLSVQLLEDMSKEWVFVVEDEEQDPLPGSELYVRIDKRTGKVLSYFGK